MKRFHTVYKAQKKDIVFRNIFRGLSQNEKNYSATVSVATTTVLSQLSQAVLSFSHFVHSVHSVVSAASFALLFEQVHAADANIVATTAKVIRTFFIVLFFIFKYGAKVHRKIENASVFFQKFICSG